MNNELEVGDVVELKSGGGRMTIKCLKAKEEKERVVCIYFINGELKEEHFVEKTLKKI